MNEVALLKEFVKKENKKSGNHSWTQERLAGEIGVTLHTVHRWFKGKIEHPSPACRVLIHQFLDKHFPESAS